MSSKQWLIIINMLDARQIACNMVKIRSEFLWQGSNCYGEITRSEYLWSSRPWGLLQWWELTNKGLKWDKPQTVVGHPGLIDASYEPCMSASVWVYECLRFKVPVSIEVDLGVVEEGQLAPWVLFSSFMYMQTVFLEKWRSPKSCHSCGHIFYTELKLIQFSLIQMSLVKKDDPLRKGTKTTQLTKE